MWKFGSLFVEMAPYAEVLASTRSPERIVSNWSVRNGNAYVLTSDLQFTCNGKINQL